MSLKDIENLPNIPELEPGIPHTNYTNQLARALNSHQHAIIIGQVDEPPLSGSKLVPVEISSSISGQGGRYNGKSITRATDTAATGDLATANIGTASATEDVVVWNLAELGTSEHGLSAPTVVWGENIGTATGGKPIIQLPFYSTEDISGTAKYQVKMWMAPGWVADFVRAH